MNSSKDRTWQFLVRRMAQLNLLLDGNAVSAAKFRPGGGGRLGGNGRGGGKAGVEPAGMHPAIQAVGGFGVDMALPHQTAESGLNMGAWAAKAVVKVEVAEGGVEVVAPQQAHHPAAKPDAFRIARRPAQQARGFRDLVDAFLAFLGGVGTLFLRLRRLGGAGLRERRRERRSSRPPRRMQHATDASRRLSASSRRN